MTSPGTLNALFFALVCTAAVFEAAGDIILKKWALDGRPVFFVIGLATYLAATVVWALSLRHEYLSKAISTVTILNLIIVILFGIVFFKEELSALNTAGILLGLVSIALMQM